MISQSPAKGSEVVRGAQVKVVVSKGPEEKPMENRHVIPVTIPYEPPVSDAIDEELDEDGNLREPEAGTGACPATYQDLYRGPYQ